MTTPALYVIVTPLERNPLVHMVCSSLEEAQKWCLYIRARTGRAWVEIRRFQLDDPFSLDATVPGVEGLPTEATLARRDALVREVLECQPQLAAGMDVDELPPAPAPLDPDASRGPQYTVASGGEVFGLFDSRAAAEKYARYLRLRGMQANYTGGPAWYYQYRDRAFHARPLTRDVPEAYRAEDVDAAIAELERYFAEHKISPEEYFKETPATDAPFLAAAGGSDLEGVRIQRTMTKKPEPEEKPKADTYSELKAFLDEALRSQERWPVLMDRLEGLIGRIERTVLTDEEAEEGRKYWLEELRAVGKAPRRFVEKIQELRTLAA